MDHLAVGIHEFYTSCKCPRKDCNEFVQDKGNRTKFCPGCRQYYDRDAVGSENIATICKEFIEGRPRPTKFMPAP